MSVKKWFILCSIVIFSASAYAQKGVTKAVETAVERQVFNRANLPTLRDGMRNLVTRRLGKVPSAAHPLVRQPVYGVEQAGALWVNYPTRSVLNFKSSLEKEKQQEPVAEIPQIVGGRHSQRKDGFYSAAQPGSGHIAAIALPAYALIKQAAVAQFSPVEERKVLLQMAEILDNGFEMSAEGNWNLKKKSSFQQIHQLIGHFKSQWPTYSQSYGGSGEPLTPGEQTALDVLDIQTWMLEHNGAFPQAQNGAEGSLRARFEELMSKMSQDAVFAADPAVQGAMQHLVHLRATANGAMSPFEVIGIILKRVENGERIPGSSLVRVTPEEEVLTRELNYVAQLYRSNLLSVLLPMERSQSVIHMNLMDFQNEGRLYRKMIGRIPEFAHDGVTLNVPARSATSWQRALEDWQAARKKAGLSQTPRSMITGQFGLPINFNDLTAEEQAEVLLGTYLKVK